jgi:hypothetical protein
MSESVRLITESPNNETLPARRGPGDLHEAAASFSLEEFKIRLRAMKDRRQAIDEFVREVMVEGVDFGPPFPRSDKKTLLKPGGEKLLTYFGFRARPKVGLGTIVKLEQEVPLIHYEIETVIINHEGHEVATGYGSANSLEEKYRYRNAHRTCPDCGQESIIKGKAEYGGGWLCFQKRGGCGAKFKENDPRITEQSLGKVANGDVGGLHHTIMRIAKKRSLLDAVQIANGTSGLFDIEEDADDPTLAATPQPQEPTQSRGSSRTSATSQTDVITEAEQKTFVDTYTKAGHKAADVARYLREKHKVDISRSRIPRALYDQVLKELADTSPLFEKGGEG